MKKLLILLLLLAACDKNVKLEGEPSDIQLKGYIEMCEREPDLEVCNEKDS